jgi:hypothetical protein
MPGRSTMDGTHDNEASTNDRWIRAEDQWADLADPVLGIARQIRFRGYELVRRECASAVAAAAEDDASSACRPSPPGS